MRIGIFAGKIQESTRGGGATYQMNVLNGLMRAKTGHEFYIFYNNEKQLFEDKDNLKFINLYAKKKKNIFSLFGGSKPENAFNEKVLENNIELVWFLVPVYDFVEAPYIMTVWDLQHRLQSYFPEVSLSGWTFEQREAFYQRAIPKAAYIIIGNSEGARELQEFYAIPQERIRTIPFFTPQFVFETEPDDSVLQKYQLEKQKYLFYPAQFWPHKNHIRLLKTLKILKEQGLDFKAVFCGADKGNQAYIKEKAAEYGLFDDVKFLGFVSEPELISLYKNAFAMTFLSMFGPDNLPPLEAMALGCPVICADAKGMKDQLDDCALFFSPVDESELAQKIKLLCESEDVREIFVNRGIEMASNLTVDKYISAAMALFDEFAPIRECWSSKEKYKHL